MKIYFTYGPETKDEYEKHTAGELVQFAPASVEEVYGQFILEKEKNLEAFMEALYKILTPAGKATFVVRTWSSTMGYEDPRDVRHMSESSLNFVKKEWRTANGMGGDYDFDLQVGCAVVDYWAIRAEEARAQAIQRFINTVHNIQFTLTKK